MTEVGAIPINPVLHTIADGTTSVPGGSGNFTNHDTPSIVGTTVAFAGLDAASKGGIYVREIGGSLNIVANQSTRPLGGIGLVSYGSVVLDNGNVTFRADANVSGTFTTGIYATTGGATSGGFRTIADTTMMIPAATGNFEAFGHGISVDGSNTALLGLAQQYTVGSSIQYAYQGIFSHLTGSLARVLDLSTELEAGKTLTSLQLGNEGLSGGQVAFVAGFSDGSQGIYLATYSHYDSMLLSEAPILNGSLLQGASLIGGVDFSFTNALSGAFSTTYSQGTGGAALPAGILIDDGTTYQRWNLDYLVPGQSGQPFESVLLALGLDPTLIGGELNVYHDSTRLTEGVYGNLQDGEYARLADGSLQVRISHFSDIIVFSIAASSVPETSSLALLGIGAIGAGTGCVRRRRIAARRQQAAMRL